jgi:hypothetical protein
MGFAVTGLLQLQQQPVLQAGLSAHTVAYLTCDSLVVVVRLLSRTPAEYQALKQHSASPAGALQPGSYRHHSCMFVLQASPVPART